MNLRSVCTVGLAGLVGLGATLSAQSREWDSSRIRVRTDERLVHRHVVPEARQQSDDPCDNRGWDNDDYRFCEVREQTLAAGPLTVDAGKNGGIRVEGWDQSSIRVRAIVQAQARSESDARQLAAGVQVVTGAGRVSSTGPSTESRESWSVGYRINVPRQTDLDLNASNGGISITAVNGTIRFDTTNGGVRLSDLGGDVRGETRNGGLNVQLDGQRWEGAGLDVETTNGGVTLAIPDGYNADLVTGTANGGLRTEFPITVQGEIAGRRGLQTTLGSGGPPIKVRTTNGGLRISRR
jgi:hypothetical protein